MESIELLLRRTFPSLNALWAAEGRSTISHEECVGLRLPLLTPDIGPEYLPVVMLDLTKHRETVSRTGDMVIYFLDVFGEREEGLHEMQRTLELADWFSDYLRADDVITLRHVLSFRRPQHPDPDYADRYRSRTLSFSEFDQPRSYATFKWLRSIQPWEELSFCSNAMASAVAYWGLRALDELPDSASRPS